MSPPELTTGVTLPPCANNTCAVIVTFHPDDALPRRLRSIEKQVAGVWVVCNATDAATDALLSNPGTGTHILRNRENLGIAAALNQGIREALREGYSWVLLLDQDSDVSDVLITTMTDVYRSLQNERVGVLNARYQGMKPQVLGAPGEKAMQVKAAISSGSLIPASVFRSEGLFIEEMFIDLVDVEFCLRLRRRGYKVFASQAELICHRIGSESWHWMVWRRVATSNHPPIRRYYMARNTMFVAKSYWRDFPGEILHLFLYRAKSIVLLLLFEPECWEKFTMTLRGFWHGVKAQPVEALRSPNA